MLGQSLFFFIFRILGNFWGFVKTFKKLKLKKTASSGHRKYVQREHIVGSFLSTSNTLEILKTMCLSWFEFSAQDKSYEPTHLLFKNQILENLVQNSM